MQKAVKRFVATRLSDAEKATGENKSDKIPHGLALIDMPTGSGKTTNTITLIEQYIRGATFQAVPRIFYLTPLNKNVKDAYERLKGRFQKDMGLFEENVLWIQANAQCVIDNLETVASEIPYDLKAKESFKELRNYVSSYNQVKDDADADGSRSQLKASLENDIRIKYERAFREDVKAWAAKLGSNQKERLQKIKAQHQWLIKLYPALLSQYRKVFFMSVDKFCAVNDPLVGKSYRFINSPLTKGALIFIDEIDASKEFILRSQIEESVQKKIDLIRLFSTLTASFAADRKFPSENFPDPEDGIYKHGSKYAFDEMKKVLVQRRKEFHLDYPFKLENGQSQDRAFLFEDHSIHTISSTKKDRYIYIETDQKRAQNLIKVSDKAVSKEKGFYRMIYGMNGALSFSIRSFIIMSRNYLSYYNNKKKGPSDDRMEPEEAVSTILAPFELDDKLEASLQKMVVDDFSFPIAGQKKSLVDSDFYTDGVRYFDFIDDISHDTMTSIGMCFLNETPEKFLFNLASRSMVIGISATATIETVTGNYNLSFLRRKLGKGYYVVPPEDANRMKEETDKLESAKDYQINVAIVKSPDGDEEELAKNIFNSPDNVDILASQLSSFDVEGKSKAFAEKRYIRTLLAIKSFLSNPKGKAILVLTNNNLRPRSYDVPFSIGVMEDLINRMNAEPGSCNQPFVIHVLFGGNFDREKEAYKRDIKSGKRVILFSSYPASGTGQNLQYSIVDGEDEKHEMEKDIDSLYLEKPTNIIVNMRPLNYDENHALSENDLIKYVYQAESLRSTGEVSPKKSLLMIRKGFKVFMKGETKSTYDPMTENEYHTESVNNHIVRTLEQAVGRICRTRDSKKENVNIYVDEEIYAQVRFGVVKDKPMNREFRAIIEKSELSEPVDPELAKNLNVGAERSERLANYLNSYMKDTKISWTQEQMSGWKELREFVLTNPTSTKKRAEETGHSILYFDCSLGHLASSAFYNYESGSFKMSYNQVGDGKFKGEISALDSNLCFLMKIPCVRKYFQEKGYATNFAPNECILNPVAYVNLYKGALGEAAGLAILRNYGIELAEIQDEEEFEKFDYCLKDDPKIFVDFKNWNILDSVSANEQITHIEDKLKRIGGKKAYIINIVADSSFPFHDSGKVCQFPNLVGRQSASSPNLYIDEAKVKELILNIKEAKSYGND